MPAFIQGKKGIYQ